MSPQISIIVPIYNMERYLSQCLDSIRNQTFDNWECILIDDGSTDFSSAICERYSEEDNRFKVIHESNGGLSAALNAGLDEARGEYIGFVDADDWIDPEMFATLYHDIKEYDADMSQCGYFKEYKGSKTTKSIVSQKKVIGGQQAMHDIGTGLMPSYKWIRLHKRDIITCRYPEGRNFEDIFAYGEWLRNVSKMVLNPTPLYHYRMRRSSIVHSDPAHNRYDYFLSCMDAVKMLENSDNVITEDERNANVHKAAIRACKLIARKEKNKNKRIEAIEKIRAISSHYPIAPESIMGRKNYKRAMLLQKSPRKFSHAMRLVNLFDLDPLLRESRFFA